MHCPFCNADKESLKVIDSRTCEGGKAIRRRRQCLHCDKRFTTYERVEETIKLTVIKKDGRRVPFDRNKILTGLQRACFKRPVAEADLERIVDETEEEITRSFDREVPAEVVGRLVCDRLRRVDQVAYVRFASVYRRFKTVEELLEEARAVIDSQRFDDPTQGQLFFDAASTPAGAAGGGRNGGSKPEGEAAVARSPKVTPKRKASSAAVVPLGAAGAGRENGTRGDGGPHGDGSGAAGG